ncbi:MAG TPA: hypothetical protein VFK66_02925 [Oryzihumus sp.]|nr:hypothetical protein [Oryzihumus sp.]
MPDVSAPLLGDQWPVLAGQLQSALRQEGEGQLAMQVQSLPVVARCDCGDSFCQSFYTETPPDGRYPDRLRNVWCQEPGWPGYLILDVVEERIHFVEVLYRGPLD